MITSQPFSEAAQRGFTVLDSSGDAHAFRFFVRTSIVVTKASAEGETTFDQVESIGLSDFALIFHRDGTSILRAKNPGRTLRMLFNTLGELAGLGFTVSPILFSKHAPKSFLSSFSSRSLVSLKVKGPMIGGTTVAAMEFDSPDGLTLDYLPLPDGFDYQLIHATYVVKYKLSTGRISYFASGVVRISGELSAKLIGLVEDELPQLEKRRNLFRP